VAGPDALRAFVTSAKHFCMAALRCVEAIGMLDCADEVIE
jgi:hypothetical protein